LWRTPILANPALFHRIESIEQRWSLAFDFLALAAFPDQLIYGWHIRLQEK